MCWTLALLHAALAIRAVRQGSRSKSRLETHREGLTTVASGKGAR